MWDPFWIKLRGRYYYNLKDKLDLQVLLEYYRLKSEFLYIVFYLAQKIIFKFSDLQFKAVQDTLNRYPDNMSGRGLALKSISMHDLWRRPYVV